MNHKETEMDFLSLPFNTKCDWEQKLKSELKEYKVRVVEINCINWSLNCKNLNTLINLCKEYGCISISLRSNKIETIVSAKSMGIEAYLNKNIEVISNNLNKKNSTKSTNQTSVNFHQGTLRSGEIVESDNDLFIFGDVNPGALASAKGNVFVWGKLLGTAHAGKDGNQSAKIIALQLRPLQLRIASKIARGPKDKPIEGLAEEAQIEQGEIIIRPANPSLNHNI